MRSGSLRASKVVVLALVVGAFFTAQATFMGLAAGRSLDRWTLLQETIYWLVWALFAPLILASARRWPLDAKPLRVPAAAHAMTSIGLAFAETAAAFGLYLALLVAMGQVPADRAGRWLLDRATAPVSGVFMGVFFYWVVIAVFNGVRFRELYAAERLAAADLAGRSATLEAELARSQLDALRSQLRPHFLFNTLNAISTLTVEDPEKARRMLLRLGSLLRRSLDEEQHEVPLEQELGFLLEYLEIQRVRFGDRLVVRVEIDPAVTTARVPVLFLQPLVENAIEHGGTDRQGGTSIVVRATRQDGALLLSVEDDGAGPGTEPSPAEGIGLRNTRERLRKLYGEQASLSLRSVRPDQPGAGGARVEISIPYVPSSSTSKT
jgi:two-component system, LytTR family, sensor kinase